MRTREGLGETREEKGEGREKKYRKDIKEVEEDRLGDDEEEKNMRKLYWLIIRELDAMNGAGPNPNLPGQYTSIWEFGLSLSLCHLCLCLTHHAYHHRLLQPNRQTRNECEL